MPKSIDELKEQGAINAPIGSEDPFRRGHRGPRGPRQVRVWEATVQVNGKPVQKICTYSVPKNLGPLRRQMQNKIERDKRLAEIQGDGADGRYYATVYAPSKEGPVPKEVQKGPLKPLSAPSEPETQIGKFLQCPTCQALRQVVDEDRDQETHALLFSCNHTLIKKD